MPGKIIDKPNCTVFIPMFEKQYTTDISVLVFYPGNALNTLEARDVFVKPLKEAMLKIRDKYVIVVANTSSTKWELVKKEYTEAMVATPMGDGTDTSYVLKEKTISISVFDSSGSGTADIQTNLVSINPLHLLIMNTVSGTLIQNVKTLISKGTSCYLMYDLEFYNSMPDLKALMPSLVTKITSAAVMLVFATVTVPATSVAEPIKSVAAPPFTSMTVFTVRLVVASIDPGAIKGSGTERVNVPADPATST